jgi:hypothetical protein
MDPSARSNLLEKTIILEQLMPERLTREAGQLDRALL